MNNPLLEPFGRPYDTAPFSSIQTAHFKPAFAKAIEMAKEAVDAIVQNPENPDFENTVEALEFSGETLDRISSIFFNLNAAETNPAIQQIAQEVSPLLTAFSNDIRLNEGLFKRIEQVYQQKTTLSLDSEQQMLLEKTYKNFSRNGASLQDKDKKKLRKTDSELARLSLTFGENVLAETHDFTLHITDENCLEGLPDSALEAAKMVAEERAKEGWVFTLDYPSYLPFMTYAKNRSLRKEMALAFGARGYRNNQHDNQQIVRDIVTKRRERAHLLGYETHADFVLEERMAESPDKVFSFLDDLLKKAKSAADKQFRELSDFARKDGVAQLQLWDTAYYSEKLKKERFNLDQEVLKPYFQLENVLQGVFEIAHKLFGLCIEEVFDIDRYHPEVNTYKVSDATGNFKAVLYTDFFPRAGKRNGAWMTSFKAQWQQKGQHERPHIAIVCNFTKPTASKPSLLTFQEVTTLFHEFGHALHGMLANTRYPSLSGTSVSWDFVELPSQLLENWCYEEAALSLFAKHYKTGEPLPMTLVEKIRESANFMEGLQTLRQLSFGLLDMYWHGRKSMDVGSLKATEKAAFSDTRLYPEVPETCMSTSFSHIFQGGYAAGYYSYKWAEVLDADAFAYIKELGIFNQEVAEKLKRCILEKGGTEKPMDLYQAFRGKAPSSKALLKRAGLLT